MSVSQKFCFYGCTCNKADCPNLHKIKEAEERKLFYDNIYRPLREASKELFCETDPTGCRHRACEHSLFCNRENCGFKHNCSFEGRQLLTKEWAKKKKQMNIKKSFEKLEKLGEGQADLLSALEELKKLVIFNQSAPVKEKEAE